LYQVHYRDKRGPEDHCKTRPSSLTCFIRRVHQHHQHAGQHHHFGRKHALDAKENTIKEFGFLSESRTNPLRVVGWRDACPAALHSSRSNTRFSHDTQNKIIYPTPVCVIILQDACKAHLHCIPNILLFYNMIITVADVKTNEKRMRNPNGKNISRQERKNLYVRSPLNVREKHAKDSRKKLAYAVTWTRNAGDDTGVTDASELTRCRRVPEGDVGGGFRFSWMVAVPRSRNNRDAVVAVASSVPPRPMYRYI